MAKRKTASVNPEALTWARQGAGYPTIEDAVSAITYLRNLKDGQASLRNWEDGSAMPSVAAAEKLRKAYGASFTFFYQPPVKVSIIPETLAWARQEAGYPAIEDAVSAIPYLKSLKDGQARLLSWEDGSAIPSVVATRSLGRAYGVSHALFYLPLETAKEQLPDVKALTDFRTGSNRKWTPNLIFFLREVMESQQQFHEILEEDDIADLSWIGKWQSKPAEAIARDLSDKLWQGKQPSKKAELRDWIRQAEKHFGVAVMQPRPYHTKSIEDSISGVALADDKIPVVVLNSNDIQEKRIFTLLHELAHLMINAPGISRHDFDEGKLAAPSQKVEWLCDRVAELTLMPEDVFRAEWVKHRDDRDNIKALSRKTGASHSACAVRAYHLNLIDEEEVKGLLEVYRRSHLDKKKRLKERGKKPCGGGINPSLKARDRVGPRMTLKSLLAYDEGRISVLDLYDIFGVKLKHLSKIAERVDYSLVHWHPPPDKVVDK